MRTYKTVYKQDGSPIEVVTVENDRTASDPKATPVVENAYKVSPPIENKQVPFGPRSSVSELDK